MVWPLERRNLIGSGTIGTLQVLLSEATLLFGLGVADIAQVDHLHGEWSHQVRAFAEVWTSDYAYCRQPDHVVPKHCSEGSATSDAIALMDCNVEQRLDVGFEGSRVSTRARSVLC